MWPIEAYGDHAGPGGYDSQLFLSSFKNWMLSSTYPLDNTKEASLSSEQFYEPALQFLFRVFRGLGSGETVAKPRSSTQVRSSVRKKAAAASTKRRHDDDPADDTAESSTKWPLAKRPKRTARDLILQKAKSLVDKAKTSAKHASQAKQQQHSMDDRRAIWTPAEDEIILLIKCTQMYFLPNERSVAFKLIADVANVIMPQPEKKVGSFGRRMKMLMKSRASVYVINKLELCRQDRTLEALYAEVSSGLNSITNNSNK